MSSLFEDIQKITSNKKKPEDYEQAYILESTNIHGQMETVRLNEAKKVLSYPKPSLYAIAKSMVEMTGLHNYVDPENEPEKTIKQSTKVFAQHPHLQESWKVMGSLVERAHTVHELDLKEMVGTNKEKQIELMEFTLDLPWKLDYSEPVEVELHDYPVPNQDHLFKGTEPEDVEEDEVEDEMETEQTSIKDRLRKKLNEQRKKG